MPRLGDTTATLLRRKRDAGGKAMRPAAGRMRLRSDQAANPGQLQMFSYAPPGLGPNAPLVVVLHGCGQSAVEYASGAGWLALADHLGFAVLAPQQTTANNPNRCFSWFSPQHARRGRGEAASIAAAVAPMVKTEGLDAERVFVTGLSAGGAMTMVMLASYPDLFAGGAVVAGLPFGVANDVVQAMAAMRQPGVRPAAELGRLVPSRAARPLPRLTVWHGEADHVVSPVNAQAIAMQWAAAQGLPEQPDRVVSAGRRSKSVWLEPGGDVAIEVNLVRGLGHGVPLSTAGVNGIGKTGPFMLEAGVSSSREIAAFWGIGTKIPAEAVARVPLPPSPPIKPTPSEDRPGRRDPETSDAPLSRQDLGSQVLASVSDHVPPGVHAVIAKALKTAGLMR